MLSSVMPVEVTEPAHASAPDDAALAREAAAGSVQAYERIYRRHAPRLYALVFRICGRQAERAEDVLQDTFVKAWRALPGFRFDSALATWLQRLAVNTALMELRARGGMVDRENGEHDLEALAGADAGARCAGTGLDLERAVATLPPRARAVLVLHDIEGWKHHEIAEELGMAVGSSKAQLHRARGLLRQRLGESR
ncbi:sigma-70 family RNA polymerase sigma factor [Luteimonas sp. RD2P54]|uniref:Sigma-70 family RNA polymerase sigma factor n=1 Tax=Luteimonas endophytica TaxID=3042023 RepID=A0ABT6JAW7_9GAMM|nr:sigma-70 family RNA polymerase sigma factor [Luteimonas endophytica]MDH5823730.1 sigma-70 family RNA polymerase sigma factor [Luteimonas endophytica]